MNLLNTGTDTTKIYTTKDYSIFGYILGNRDIVQNHVLNLAKLIKEIDLEVPIIVNEKMEVCDGQHESVQRGRAAEEGQGLCRQQVLPAGRGLHLADRLR